RCGSHFGSSDRLGLPVFSTLFRYGHGRRRKMTKEAKMGFNIRNEEEIEQKATTNMDPLFIPERTKKARVILNTDAKNEADDQYAIVHAILTPSFDLTGIIPAHFGPHRSATSQQDSQEE